jgi:hypothetical protein
MSSIASRFLELQARLHVLSTVRSYKQLELPVTVSSQDSLIDDVRSQNQRLADLCKQAEALLDAARRLCDHLTERIQHTRNTLRFQGVSDRRKTPRR